MKGSEFLKRVRKASKRNGWAFEWHPDLGKGSHGVLLVNGRMMVLRNLSDELKTGTYHAMLKQLGVKGSDL